MNVPDVWGAGSIFAFSGLDGKNTIKNSLTGYIKSDGIGVRFNSDTTIEIVFDIEEAKGVTFLLVASDAVHFTTNDEEGEKQTAFMFLNESTVIGFSHDGAVPFASFGTERCRLKEDNILTYSSTKAYFAFARQQAKKRIVFAFSKSRKSREDASEKARNGLMADIDELLTSKYDFFRRLPRLKANDQLTEKTLAKCFSIMKSQVYSPEGEIKCRWTTPDRLPHEKMWLWDSVFHALGNKYISKDLAIDTIDALFSFQKEDGFMPHMMAPGICSQVTQPPIIAWGSYKLFEFTKDQSILDRFYDKLKKYLMWNFENRDRNHNYLFEWEVYQDDPNCRCAESGMDNSPRFDFVKMMDCVDFSCFMANEARYMSKIAQTLGLVDEAIDWKVHYEKIKGAINEHLWDEEDEFYYDRVTKTGELKKVQAVSSFLPLFSGVCNIGQAKRLANHLNNKSKFNTPFPIPSIAADDKTFGTDMWRGPVWINYNYMIVLGLREYGFDELAEKIVAKTLETAAFWYKHDGVLYEFYDSNDRVSPSRLNRKGKPVNPYNPRIRMQTIRDYGWSASLFSAMAIEHYYCRL